jgi:hypothetical protein
MVKLGLVTFEVRMMLSPFGGCSASSPMSPFSPGASCGQRGTGGNGSPPRAAPATNVNATLSETRELKIFMKDFLGLREAGGRKPA